MTCHSFFFSINSISHSTAIFQYNGLGVRPHAYDTLQEGLLCRTGGCLYAVIYVCVNMMSNILFDYFVSNMTFDVGFSFFCCLLYFVYFSAIYFDYFVTLFFFYNLPHFLLCLGVSR